MKKRLLGCLIVLALVLMAGCTSTQEAVSYDGATETEGATLIIDAIVYVETFDDKSVDERWRGKVSSVGKSYYSSRTTFFGC